MKQITKNIFSKDGGYWLLYYLVYFIDKCIPVNDKFYLRLSYRCTMGKPLDLKSPKLFSEKLQWLKLYYRNDNFTCYVDKYEVKAWISEKLGEEHVVPTLGVWNKAEEIEWGSLPNQFVLKCSHDSGGIVICKDKGKIDKGAACLLLNKCLNHDYSKNGREWPYKNVHRRIFAEKYMVDSLTGELRDYKFFCFNGVVRFFKIDFDRFIKHRANYYDPNGKFVDMGEVICPGKREADIKIPENLEEMIKKAEILSQGIPFVRVDFYNCQGKIYFGEMTFFPASGMELLYPDDCDKNWGKLLELPTKNNKL